MSFSVIIEKDGFSARDETGTTIDTLRFGEVITRVGRFDPASLCVVYDDPVTLTDQVFAGLHSAGFGTLLSRLISEQAPAAYRSCIEDPEKDAPLPELICEELGFVAIRARVLCCLLSDELLNCAKSRREIIEPLLGSVKLSCSFLYEGEDIKIAYSISDLSSLLILDTLYCNQNGIRLNKCENCGHFFLPTTRSDEKYCPFRDADSRECRKVGYENKVKASELGALYRKIYKTQNSRKNRNLHNVKDADHRFSRWVKYACDLKVQCERGKISLDEFEALASDPFWLKTKNPGFAPDKV